MNDSIMNRLIQDIEVLKQKVKDLEDKNKTLSRKHDNHEHWSQAGSMGGYEP